MKAILAVTIAAAAIFGACVLCFYVGRLFWQDDYCDDGDFEEAITQMFIGIAALSVAAMVLYVLYKLGVDVILPAIGIKNG